VSFEEQVEQVIGLEGRYSNDPNDPGGETIWGITISVARSNGYTGSMRDMPRDVAIAIYRSEYWNACSCDQMPAKLADMVFKQSVNEGVPKVKRMLQQALGVTVDGNIGPQTIHAANVYQPADELVALFLAECLLAYTHDAGFPEYGKGWFKRVILTALEG
jgi:lysozyme family protein